MTQRATFTADSWMQWTAGYESHGSSDEVAAPPNAECPSTWWCSKWNFLYRHSCVREISGVPNKRRELIYRCCAGYSSLRFYHYSLCCKGNVRQFRIEAKREVLKFNKNECLLRRRQRFIDNLSALRWWFVSGEIENWWSERPERPS